MTGAFKKIRFAIAAWLAPDMAEKATRCIQAEMHAQWASRAVIDHCSARAAETEAAALRERVVALEGALELHACDCTGRCDKQQSWPAMAKNCARAQARYLLRARNLGASHDD